MNKNQYIKLFNNYNAKEFKKKLADNSITLNFTTTQDNFYIDLYTLKENLELAFELLDLALTEPRFDLEEIKRLKNMTKLVLEESEKDPDEISSRLFKQILFKDHPYQYNTLGLIEHIDEIKKKDLEIFMNNNFRLL